MALRRANTDKRQGDGADAHGAVADKVGESIEECVALGQALVEAGHLTGEMLAPALADGDGDLWEFGQILLTKYGIGRAEYAHVSDAEALQAFQTLARLEGILPALESAHAMAYTERLARELGSSAVVLVNLSGRGDKDVQTVEKWLGAKEPR